MGEYGKPQNHVGMFNKVYENAVALRKARGGAGRAYTHSSQGASRESEQGSLTHKDHQVPGRWTQEQSEKWSKDKGGKWN